MSSWINKQWDIFIEDRRKQREKRRERKKRRQEKRRKRYRMRSNKKPFFLKFFFKRIAILFIIAIIFCGCITIAILQVYRKNSEYSFEKKYESAKEDFSSIYGESYTDSDNSQGYGESIYENGEWNQLFLNFIAFRLMAVGESDNHNTFLALYDRQTRERLADNSSNSVLLLKRNPEAAMEYYIVEEETVQLLEDLDFYNFEDEKDYVIEDIYIKDGQAAVGIVYQVIGVKEEIYDETSGRFDLNANIVDYVDNTPENADEYEHLARYRGSLAESDDSSDVSELYTLLGPSRGGFSSEDSIYQLFEQYFSDEKYETYVEKSLTGYTSEELTFFGVNCIYCSSFELQGRVVDLAAVGNYNLFADYGHQFLLFYLGVFLLILLIALILSLQAYTYDKIRYETETYRKNIMNAMAHDLKSPLMVISGYAENLAEGIKPEKTEEYANSIRDTIRYMNHTIANILELAKTEETFGKLNLEKIDLRAITEEIVKKYELLLEEKELIIRTEGGVTVEADRNLLLRVIDNLIGNAVKYAKTATEIEICIDKKSLKITNYYSGKIENIDTLTQAFVKGDHARSGKNGTGLGLAIVKNILDAHDYQFKLDIHDELFTAKIIFK